MHHPSKASTLRSTVSLKPGGIFGVYEWLMTNAYDNGNPRHREIRLGIEIGDGISDMEKIEVALKAMKAAGFEMEHHKDLAERERWRRRRCSLAFG